MQNLSALAMPTAGEPPSHILPANTPLRIPLSQAIIQPVLSNLVSEQAIASRDQHPDPTLIGFSADALLKRFAFLDETLRLNDAPQAGERKTIEKCSILNKDDVENIIVAQRRVIIRLNRALKRLHPSVANGRPEGHVWWNPRRKKKVAVQGDEVKAKQDSADDFGVESQSDHSEFEDIGPEVGRSLSVKEVREGEEVQNMDAEENKEVGANEDEHDEHQEDADDGESSTKRQSRIWELPVGKSQAKTEATTDLQKGRSWAEVAGTRGR